MVDADVTHIREPIKCDACRAFIIFAHGIRANVRRCRHCRRRGRRCYLPIGLLDVELTILYGNPRLGYRLLKALTGCGRLCTRCIESQARDRSFVLYLYVQPLNEIGSLETQGSSRISVLFIYSFISELTSDFSFS